MADRGDIVHPAEIDGERVLFSAELDPTWLQFRACTCGSMGFAVGGQGAPVVGPVWALIYALAGLPSREEEMESFSLHLTATSLVFKQKIYQGGMCCAVTKQKSIPLDKITDVVLQSDCCGDCCGYSTGTGVPYKMVIMTAGSPGADGGGTGAGCSNVSGSNTTIFCIKDLEDFASRIRVARRALVAHGMGVIDPSGSAGAHGAAKVAIPVAPTVASASPFAGSEAVLERMEALMREAIGEMKPGSGTG